MRAAVATENGLEVREIDAPTPGPEEVLVRVRASGLNRADLNAAKGAGISTKAGYGAPIGLEWAGEIVEVGKAVTSLAPGDRVVCSGGGGYAEYAIADVGRTYRMSEGLSFEEAGVLPVALATAHDALVTHGRMRAGDGVFVHGASSGVGLATMRIARLLGAGFIAGSSGDSARRARLPEFGADLTVDPHDPRWPDAILAATQGAGVQVIVDMVTGVDFSSTMRAAALQGRIVNVGRLGGFRGEFDFDFHALRRLEVIGVTFRTRSLVEVREIVTRVRDEIWPYVETGALRMPVDARFALNDAAAAHEHMRANRHFGKIVLVP